MTMSFASPKPWRLRRRLVLLAAFAAVLAAAFTTGAQLTASVAYGARLDSCVATESADTRTVMTKTTNYYNCHPDQGNALPHEAPIGTIAQGANPAVTGRWWNTVAVDGDAGSACQPTTKWLRGSGYNWFSATCTQAP